MLTSDMIDLAWLEAATLEDLKSAMRAGPEVLGEVNALLQTPEGKKIASEMLNDPDYVPKSRRQPTPEEAAQVAADTARAEAEAAAAAAVVVPVSVPVVPSYEAEDAALRKEGITVQRDAQGAITRIVQDYQVLGENDHPIGRPTHLEARNWPELVLKQKAAHENAVRYAERVKTNKIKQSTETLKTFEASDAAELAHNESVKFATEAVNEKDPAKMQIAVQKSIDAERKSQESLTAARERGAIIAESWMETHEDDFLPCQAATQILSDWLNQNKKPITFANLEAAYSATKHQLPKPERPAVAVAPAAPVDNPPAAAAVASAPVTPPIPAPMASAAATPSTAAPVASSQPPASAPAPAPVAAAKSAEATRRPGVNGGIVPGSLSAQRPTETVQPTTTRAELLHEVNKMSRDEYRRKLKDANFVKRLEAAGIPVAGQRNQG